MAGKIFISYRRSDDPGSAQALFAHLAQSFGAEELFMDVADIEPGLNFVQVLKDQVARCDVLIAVIGKGWIDARDDTGARRLDNPEDFVRIEIEFALKLGKRVIPVLVRQAQMPRADELPESMKSLAACNAVPLTHERFQSDTRDLIAALQRVLGTENAKARQRAVPIQPFVATLLGVACMVLLLAGVLWYRWYFDKDRPIAALARLGWAITKVDGKSQFEVHRAVPSMQEFSTYFAQLTEPFRLSFINVLGLNDLHYLSNAERCTTITVMLGNFTDISELKGFRYLKNLIIEDLPADKQGVVDASALSSLLSLQTLTLSGSRVRDVEFLASTTKLTQLSLASTLVSDISTVSRLPVLDSLNIAQTGVMDLEPLSHAGEAKPIADWSGTSPKSWQPVTPRYFKKAGDCCITGAPAFGGSCIRCATDKSFNFNDLRPATVGSGTTWKFKSVACTIFV